MILAGLIPSCRAFARISGIAIRFCAIPTAGIVYLPFSSLNRKLPAGESDERHPRPLPIRYQFAGRPCPPHIFQRPSGLYIFVHSPDRPDEIFRQIRPIFWLVWICLKPHVPLLRLADQAPPAYGRAYRISRRRPTFPLCSGQNAFRFIAAAEDRVGIRDRLCPSSARGERQCEPADAAHALVRETAR